MWMMGLPLLVIALLYWLMNFNQEQREKELLRKMKTLQSHPEAQVNLVDEAIEVEKAREEFWRRQNPRGGL